MKRYFCTILFPILVANAGCTSTDNNVGSLGRDARVVDGPGRDASGVPAQQADANHPDSPLADAAVPDAASVAKDAARESTLADRTAPDGASVIKDVAQESPPASVAPDAANLAKDAAQGAPDAGTGPQCQSDGCDAPAAQPADICTTVEEVWYVDAVEWRRDVNCASNNVSTTGFCDSFPEDACDGYRCLVGNEISPGCDTSEKCQTSCSGTCVLIASMREQCSKADGGAGPQCQSGGGICQTWPAERRAICINADMVWRDDAGSELRRELNCLSDGYVASGSCYSFVQDPCGGYRCLVGNEISPACYTSEECQAACIGACLPIPSMRAPCSKVYGSPIYQCQLNADGTCSAVTPDTSCTPFAGRLYGESAGCYSTMDTTLGCCATASGEPCFLPAGIGCYQVAAAVGTLAYWTPSLVGAGISLPKAQACDQARYAKVASAPPCRTTSTDAAAADAAKDATQDADAAHQCRLNADGTCSAITPNTACAQFFGHRYDDGAGCFADEWTTLGCCATASGEFCSLPAQSGCYQVAATGGIYWTPALATAAVTISGGQACDETRNQVVPAAHPCRMPSDAGPSIPLPRCGSDSECCVTVDWCSGTAQLNGTDPVPGRQLPPGVCLACIPPAIQVQCQGGYCVGTRLNIYDSSSRLLYSHCGYIAPPDAGAAHAVSPHAVVDGGVSYKTSWSCGDP